MRDRKQRIVLFNPHHFEGPYATEQRQPLALLAAAALPDAHGYEVVIVDATVQPDYHRRVLEACRGALCFGTTAILGYQTYHAALMARAVREAYPNLPIVAGGWFPSVRPRLVLEQGGADIVVVGQGERTFMAVLEAIRGGGPLGEIDGIVYRDGEQIIHTPRREPTDLNDLPPAPYHRIDFERYFDSDPYDRLRGFIRTRTGDGLTGGRVRTLYYVSSYGCPDACAFCSSPGAAGRRSTRTGWWTRSPTSSGDMVSMRSTSGMPTGGWISGACFVSARGS